MGRFLCNTLQEALDSATQTVAGRRREFDVIVIGGGTFGVVVAEHLLVTDRTRTSELSGLVRINPSSSRCRTLPRARRLSRRADGAGHCPTQPQMRRSSPVRLSLPSIS